jgi:hypothetical protein
MEPTKLGPCFTYQRFSKTTPRRFVINGKRPPMSEKCWCTFETKMSRPMRVNFVLYWKAQDLARKEPAC